MISQFTFMLSAGLPGLALPRPDVVLIEGQPIFTAIAGVLIATLKRRPYVLNVSDVWPEHALPVALSERYPRGAWSAGSDAATSDEPGPRGGALIRSGSIKDGGSRPAAPEPFAGAAT